MIRRIFPINANAPPMPDIARPTSAIPILEAVAKINVPTIEIAIVLNIEVFVEYLSRIKPAGIRKITFV